MPKLDERAVVDWLTEVRPVTAAEEWPPAIRPIEAVADAPQAFEELGGDSRRTLKRQPGSAVPRDPHDPAAL